jgi:hypothetical protein
MLPNNAVAQSDLDAAIQAIEQSFQEALGEHPQNNNDTTRSLLLQDTQQSLIKHLKRIVDPVADTKFQDYVDLYHVVQEEEEEEEDYEDEDEHNEISEDEEEEEVDDEDFIDTEALGEARLLRTSVRELSQNVQEIRERVLKDSLETNLKEDYTTLLENLEQNRPSVSSTDQDSNVVESQRVALDESLQALSGLLNDSQWSKLPQQLESLQSTIDVIQKNTDKNREMSQTEAAIISRCNSAEEDSDWDALLSSQDSTREGEILVSASDRLARFFEQLE